MAMPSSTMSPESGFPAALSFAMLSAAARQIRNEITAEPANSEIRVQKVERTVRIFIHSEDRTWLKPTALRSEDGIGMRSWTAAVTGPPLLVVRTGIGLRAGPVAVDPRVVLHAVGRHLHERLLQRRLDDASSCSHSPFCPARSPISSEEAPRRGATRRRRGGPGRSSSARSSAP